MHTEEMIATTLKKLCLEKPLSKITITDICSKCQINRTTFYRHFIDKDDLIRWIFIDDISSHYVKATPEDWPNNTLRLLKIFHTSCAFYKQALDINSINNLEAVLHENALIRWTEFVDSYLIDRYGDIHVIDDDKKDFIIRFYSHSFNRLHIDYIKSGAKEEPQVLIQYYIACIRPGFTSSIDELVRISSKQL